MKEKKKEKLTLKIIRNSSNTICMKYDGCEYAYETEVRTEGVQAFKEKPLNEIKDIFIREIKASIRHNSIETIIRARPDWLVMLSMLEHLKEEEHYEKVA